MQPRPALLEGQPDRRERQRESTDANEGVHNETNLQAKPTAMRRAIAPECARVGCCPSGRRRVLAGLVRESRLRPPIPGNPGGQARPVPVGPVAGEPTAWTLEAARVVAGSRV